MRRLRYLLVLAVGFSQAGCRLRGSQVKETASAALNTSPGSFDCHVLSSGFFWYGKGNQAQKAVTGGANPFYDPAKKTVIYFHGWQAGAFATQSAETFHFDVPSANANAIPDDGVGVPVAGGDGMRMPSTTPIPDDPLPAGAAAAPVSRSAASATSLSLQDQKDNLADAWIDAGWNIGLFNWTQFADDTIYAAEAKIWSVKGPLKWRGCSGFLQDSGLPTGTTVTDLAVLNIVSAMTDYHGTDLRLVGHSLGSQLAARVASALVAEAATHPEHRSLKPSRVAQLDPYWSAWNSVDTAGSVTAIAQNTITNAGVIWELYKTSKILDLWLGAKNTELTNLIGELKFSPELWGPHTLPLLRGPHVWARRLYFKSLNEAEASRCGATKCLAASLANAEAQAFMQAQRPYVQTQGNATETLSDDAFGPPLVQSVPTE